MDALCGLQAVKKLLQEHRRAVIVSEGGMGKTYLAVDVGRDFREHAGTILVNVRGAVSEDNIMERFCAALKINPAQVSVECRHLLGLCRLRPTCEVLVFFCSGFFSARGCTASFFHTMWDDSGRAFYYYYYYYSGRVKAAQPSVLITFGVMHAERLKTNSVT